MKKSLLNKYKKLAITRLTEEGKHPNSSYLSSHDRELSKAIRDSGSSFGVYAEEFLSTCSEAIEDALHTYNYYAPVNLLVNISKRKNSPASEDFYMRNARDRKIDWSIYFNNFEEIYAVAVNEYEDFYNLVRNQEQQSDYLAKVYTQLANELHAYPALHELNEVGISRSAIRERFSGIGELREYAEARYPKAFKKVYTIDNIFNDAHHKKMMKIVKKYNRFVVTSIGSGPRFTDAVKSTMNYCKRNNALLILIPTKQNLERVDPVLVQMHLNEEIFITVKDFLLFKNLHISAMEIDEKQVNPLAGMGRYIIKGRDSFIFASPKQMRLPSPIKKKGMPRLLSTTGAITLADYKSTKYRHGRRVLMAKNDHLLGALIVETNPKTQRFHKRQIQFNIENGSCNDLGIRYNANGTVEINNPSTFVLGDLHSRVKDAEKYLGFLKLGQKLNVPKLGLHDVFDSRFCNPHDRHRSTYIQALEVMGLNSLSEELKILVDDLNTACDHGYEEVYIVDSNHDDMLQRSMDSGEIDKDPRNAFLANFLKPIAVLNHLRGKYKTKKSLMAALSSLMGVTPEKLVSTFPYIDKEKKTLQFAVELFNLKDPSKVKWLDIDSSWIEGANGPDGIGYELADHGHKGTNGSRGSLAQGAKHFLKRVTGHSHTDGQINNVFAVGHCSDIEMADYAKGGLSSWVFSGILIYDDGHAQHVTSVNGEMEYETGRLTFEKLKKNKKLLKGKEYVLPEETTDLDVEDFD